MITSRMMQQLAMANTYKAGNKDQALSPELFTFTVSEGICWHLYALDIKIYCFTVIAVLIPEIRFRTAVQMMDITCLHKFALLIFHGFLGNEKGMYNGPQIFI